MSGNPVFCPRCGVQQIWGDARFCHRCGQELTAASAAGAPAARQRNALVWLLPVVVVLLLGATVVCCLLAGPTALALLQGSPGIATAPTAMPSRTPDAGQPTLQKPTAAPLPTLPPLPPPAPTATPRPSATLTPVGKVAASAGKLRMRVGPGEAYDTVALLDAGQAVTILGQDPSGLWLKVSTPAGEGWVLAQYIETSSARSGLPILTPPATASAPAVDPRFRADKTAIGAGDCTTLRWDVDGITGVYLDGGGVAGHGTRVVCPTSTQTYVLEVAQRDGRRVQWPLTVVVSGVAPAMEFIAEQHGCIAHDMRLGQVKGQVFDRNGNIIVNAHVEILVDGQSGVVPLGRSNEDGWYEFNLSPGQRVRFVRLEVNGRNVNFAPANLEVTAQSGCYQRVDFRQR